MPWQNISRPADAVAGVATRAGAQPPRPPPPARASATFSSSVPLRHGDEPVAATRAAAARAEVWGTAALMKLPREALEAQCRAHGIDAAGRREQLVQRLDAWKVRAAKRSAKRAAKRSLSLSLLRLWNVPIAL